MLLPKELASMSMSEWTTANLLTPTTTMTNHPAPPTLRYHVSPTSPWHCASPQHSTGKSGGLHSLDWEKSLFCSQTFSFSLREKAASGKIGENRRASANIGEHRRKSAKIANPKTRSSRAKRDAFPFPRFDLTGGGAQTPSCFPGAHTAM